ncbi:stage V sporulation protein D (sporulation-specific penicillin-binding protein) [Caldanaerovirga acetigignens]|uniref:Stage V sporulation protein D (Sporulation-specific penicillin-binding protein) n=1 Tax=Caldanaerovirga acetigignens TaxID=447595 RepID=A0A1M7FS42_9FIRM|nr:stage V sporulation protein D [Caldanaerovirga acetigignens]SHM06598.1 stage V sporulation protein D (sporulation-specific penicillin-binding protein) [Caldanaerovirga acetigignens]
MAHGSKIVKKRLVFLLLICFALNIAIVGRVFYIQFVRGDELRSKAKKQWTRDSPVEPKRGTIYDRNMNPLAISASVKSVMASPPDIEDVEKTASLLSPVLNIDKEVLIKTLEEAKKKKRGSIFIKRKITDEEAEAVRTLKLKGIYFTEESKRFYPEKNLASHVLGFTGIDSQGLDGVELIYDKYLRGVPGRIISEKDALSRELPFGLEKYIPPEEGLGLVLTIDKVIQYIAERELEKAIAENDAKKGTIIVMDPKTGEILALANKPDYDPNNYKNYSSSVWRNSAISDVYEPGSTFKIVTAAAALEEGVVGPDDKFYDPGYVVVSGVRIKCWRAGGHGSQTFAQVIQNSCNPGFVEVASRLGKEKFIKYIKGFGFGDPTGIDLPGEAKGIFNPNKVGPVELATISFGQGISVTPIQLITAVAAVANDGKMTAPHIAKALVDKEGKILQEFKPRVTRQVISEDTAKELRNLLESVVENGTGGRAKIEGYKVAGKTGTAEKYADGKYVASFVGFAPADDPQFVVLVIIDEPSTGIYYGGQIAAPIFQKVMADILKYKGVKPQLSENKQKEVVKVPDVRNLYVEDAKQILIKHKLSVRIEGQGLVVYEQVPAPDSEIPAGSTVILKVSEAKTDKNPATVPDLTGRTMREASEILDAVGLKIDIKGSGFAVRQNPPPGAEVEIGTVVQVFFEPPNSIDDNE